MPGQGPTSDSAHTEKHHKTEMSANGYTPACGYSSVDGREDPAGLNTREQLPSPTEPPPGRLPTPPPRHMDAFLALRPIIYIRELTYIYVPDIYYNTYNVFTKCTILQKNELAEMYRYRYILKPRSKNKKMVS